MFYIFLYVLISVAVAFWYVLYEKLTRKAVSNETLGFFAVIFVVAVFVWPVILYQIAKEKFFDGT